MSAEYSIDELISGSLNDEDQISQRSYVSHHSVCSQVPLVMPTMSFDDSKTTVFLDFSGVAEDEASEVISLKTSEVKFRREESGYSIDKLVHDFTFGFLTQTTDVPISSHIPEASIPRSRSHLLRKTPDYIAKVEDILCLVEFGTVSSESKKTLLEHYEAKKQVYQTTMDDLSPYIQGFPYKVMVIIVGFSGIVTNMVLPDEVQRSLVYRFKIAKAIDAALITSDIKIRPIDQMANEKTKKFIQHLSTYDVEGEDEYSTENYVEKIYGEVDKVALNSVVSNAWDRAQRYIDDRNIWKIYTQPGGREKYSADKITKIVLAHTEEAQRMAPDGFSDHMKSIVNMPLVLLRSCMPNSKITKSKLSQTELIKEGSDETLRLWKSAVSSMKADTSFVDNQETIDSYNELKSDPQEIIDFVDGLPVLGPTPSDTRNLYCRVKVNIPESDAIELAKVGIQGKHFIKENDPTVKDYRKSRQLPFSLFGTDVSDFQNLFDSNLGWMIDSDYNPVCKDNERLLRDRLLLIHKASTMHKEEKLTLEYRDMRCKLSKTPYIQWSCLVSDIAFELCLALRQGCKKDVFIIKKLKDWECYILIKPVRLSSKIFFSLLWFNEDEISLPTSGNVFRETRSNGQVTWTDFISLDQNKIENWALCESRTFAMIPYWLEFHGLEPFSLFTDRAVNKELLQSSLQMMLLYTCIEIADKSEIEQEASLFRYMFMKSLTAPPLIPEPELVIEDFKKQVRSRLTIWIQQKLIQFATYCSEGNISIIQEDLELMGYSISTSSTKRLTWRGLINPYNGISLNNPGDAVNLFYIGYVQNKNLSPEDNVFGKMLEKILILEDDLTPEIAKRIGRENKPIGSDTKHEYNIDLLISATKYAKNNYIPKLHGPDSLARKIEDVVAKIANTNIEEVFATLKASSNFSEKFFVLTEEEYHRAKVIEKAQLYVHGEKTRIADILKGCYSEVKVNGYMRIDIFQKNQHGGIREIYVLGFAERVVQWVIETLARGLCSLFPGETMTHPENKKRLPEEHFKVIRNKYHGRATMTFATSADASKWSQNMYPHKFAVMLCHLLPSYLHGFIWTSMSFWKNKYIMIPQTLIKRFHENDSLMFYNKYMDGLYSAYKGTTKCDWAKKDQAYIKLRTGMMQGILHYTSSLFHSIMNVYTEMLTLKKFNKITHMEVQPLIMQSSDDSCEILTCEIPDTPKDKIIAVYALCLCQVFKAEIGEEVAIKNSTKKTAMNLQYSFEFNSAYHFGPSRYESDIKMLSSSLICTDRESIVDRHMEQYTQLTNFINAGGSIYAANFIQSAQALFNYRLLGSSITCRFWLLFESYKQLPDPNLGFFLMDNPLFTGLCGYKYNLWISIKDTAVGRTFKHYLNDALIPTEKNKKPDLISTKNGILTKRAILGFGNRMKLKKIIERMELPEDWQELLDNDPSLLFRKSKNCDEFKILCALKMNSPGVQESLSTGNITTRIMASSAYVALSTVMRSLGEWHDNELSEMEKGRLEKTYNLSQLIAHEMRIMIDNTETVSDEELKFLFPYHDEYLTLQARLSNCDYYLPKRKLVDYRRVTTDVRVFDRDNLTSLSPEIIMSAIWFQDNEDVRKPNYPLKYLRSCYFVLKRAIPWLDESLQKTLEEGPFNHINSLAAWLSQFHQKDKVVTIIGAPIVSRRGSSSILSVIRQNFHKVYQLENIQVSSPQMNSSEYITLKQTILLLLSFPQNKQEMERRCNLIFTSPLARKLSYNPSAVKSRYNMLAIIKDALNGSEPLDVLEKISQCKVGIVGGYSIPQKFESFETGYSGVGIWVGKFYDKKVKLTVNSYFDEAKLKHVSYLERVDLEDLYPMDDILFSLRTWLDENWVVVLSGKNTSYYGTRTPAIRHSRRAGLVGGIRTYYQNSKFSDDPSGVPVYIDSNLTDHLGDINAFRIEIPIDSHGLSRGVIKLMGRDTNSLRWRKDNWITLCRYVVNHRDYFGPVSANIGVKMADAMQKWVTNTAMTERVAASVINKAINDDSDVFMKEHVRDVLRNTFARKGLRLGKKRDELPLVQTAQSQYVDIMTKKQVDTSKKRVHIPSISEVINIQSDDEAHSNEKCSEKKVTWADETEEDYERARRRPSNADSLTESEVDDMFCMKTVDKPRNKNKNKTIDKIKKYLGPFESDGGNDSNIIQKSALFMSSLWRPSLLGTIQSLTPEELEIAEEVSVVEEETDTVGESDATGNIPGREQVMIEPKQDDAVITRDETLAEEDEDDDEMSIDWGDDSEEEEMINNIVKTLGDVEEIYKDTYNLMKEKMETDTHVISVAQELENEIDFDMDYLTSDNFFRDLEMINSSSYKVDVAMSETNSRNNLVKKEHLWFSNYVNSWYSEHSYDLNKLFHRRILTKKLKDAGFMKLMDFMHPDVSVTEEKGIIAFNPSQDYDPFNDDE